MSKEKIQMQMREGETLVWAGSPSEGKNYGKVDRLLLPLSAVVLAVSALFAVQIVHSIGAVGFNVVHAASLILLLIVGGLTVYSYFFRFAVKRSRKSDLVYGITSHGRVLIRDTASRKMYEFDRDQLKDARITEIDRRGVGTIYLKKKCAGNWLDNTGLDFLGKANGKHIALFDIEDCKKVYKLITGPKK